MTGPPDPTTAVLAHALLSSIAVISGAIESVLESGEQLSVEQRVEFLRLAASQADYVAEVLKDMARGLPAEVIDVLDHLSDRPGPALEQ